MKVTHVFADGGCILGNPSEHGGTWAYLHVDGPLNRKVEGRSGIVTNARFGAPVTNNAMEFLAVLKALEALPDGWSGVVASDSQCTLTRWQGSKRDFKGIPWEWSDRMQAVLARLGELTWRQLAGHPTKLDLERGRKIKLVDGIVVEGLPVSEWQAACDAQCTRLARQFREQYGIVREPPPPIVFEHALTDAQRLAEGPFAALAPLAEVLP
jgi:ribonuclease HI